MQGQGQKYGQKHETKELFEFLNHLHALTMVWFSSGFMLPWGCGYTVKDSPRGNIIGYN